jgi:hypothetical protein
VTGGRSAAGDAYEHERLETEVTVSDARFENAGLCSTDTTLGKPGFRWDDVCEGRQGGRDAVFGPLQEAQKVSAGGFVRRNIW